MHACRWNIRWLGRWIFVACLALMPTLACGSDSGDGELPDSDSGQTEDSATSDGSDTDGLDVDAAADSAMDAADSAPDSAATTPRTLHVTVTLDGQPVEGAVVLQGGLAERYVTDSDGAVSLVLDTGIPGLLSLIASHPEARTRGAEVPLAEFGDDVEIALVRFDTSDNEDFEYFLAGDPSLGDQDEGRCRHCHRALADTWWDSSHRSSASNPRLRDLYLGRASYLDQAACEQLGGVWTPRTGGGASLPLGGCRLGASVLAALDPECVDPDSCATVHTGGCADCHAPAIEGVLGGRDLREATGQAYETGVHCQTCHLTESIRPDEPPGVAGRLHLVRPSEPSTHPILGKFRPLSFGPHDDVPSPAMGAVAREHFRDGSLCAGCHESRQAVLVAGAELDSARWPSGTLPVHSTYSEWEASAYGGAVECQSCHLAPRADWGNGGMLSYAEPEKSSGGEGWLRFPGSVKSHAAIGPLQEDARMLRQALHLDARGAVVGQEYVIDVTVHNVGAGHAVPTGEPMRGLFVVVEAFCGVTPLPLTSGPTISALGGAEGVSVTPDGDWDWAATFGQAEVGDQFRIVRPGEFEPYDGVPPFDAQGPFDVAAKGLRRMTVVDVLTVTSTQPALETTPPLVSPEAGDVAYWIRSDRPTQWAGLAGRDFARVMVGPDGTNPVPHFLAVDIARDNRIKAGQRVEWSQAFAASCPEPSLRARLYYRRAPYALAEQRGWPDNDTLVGEVER